MRRKQPDHVVESVTGQLSRRMLEHYSHIRLAAKKAALDRLQTPRKGVKQRSAGASRSETPEILDEALTPSSAIK